MRKLESLPLAHCEARFSFTAASPSSPTTPSVNGPKQATDGVMTVEITSSLGYPYFRWFLYPLMWRLLRTLGKQFQTEATMLRSPTDTATPLAGKVRIGYEEGRALSIFGFAVLIANVNGSLFGQLSQSIANSFSASDQQLGDALAWMRSGTFLALMLGVLADRGGRKRMLTIALIVSCLASVCAALAPTLTALTLAGAIGRGALNAALPLAGILAVESAGEYSRAFAVAMVTLATGAGYGIGVLSLPFTDLHPNAWRFIFLAAGSTIVFLPRWYRRCPESQRYVTVRQQGRPTGRLRLPHVLGLGLVTMLSNVFAAPASQLMNRFLEDTRGYSGTQISLFRGITNGLPGMLGVLWGGRRAEANGRESSIMLGLVLGSASTAVLFAGPSWLTWPASVIAVVCAGLVGTSFGTFSAELSPTRTRGGLAGLLALVGVMGSIIGLVLAPRLGNALGGLGNGLAVLSIAPVISLVALRWLPETARQTLDDITGDASSESQEHLQEVDGHVHESGPGSSASRHPGPTS